MANYFHKEIETASPEQIFIGFRIVCFRINS